MTSEFHCMKCGTKLLDGDVFCVSCGNKIDWNLLSSLAAADAEEEKLKAEEEARIKAAEEEARRKAEEEARIKAAEEEARRKAEEEARIKAAEEEAKRQAEEEEAARREIAEAARRIEEQKAKSKAEEEAALKTKESASVEDIFCVKCGKRLPSGSLFCMHCGEKVDPIIDENAPEPTVVLSSPAQIRRSIDEEKPKKAANSNVSKNEESAKEISKPAVSNQPIKKVSESINVNTATGGNSNNLESVGNRYTNPRVAMANNPQVYTQPAQSVRPVPIATQPAKGGSKVGKILGTIVVMIALMIIACAVTFFVLNYMDSKNSNNSSGEAVTTEAPAANTVYSYIDEVEDLTVFM